MPLQDLLFHAVILLLTVWLVVGQLSQSGMQAFYRRVTWVLFVYHLLCSLVFHHYIRQYGGDSLGYWTLTADTSQEADTWSEHWGLGTFFLQWINYLPSRVLGLSYASGNFLYACFSFLGFAKLVEMGYRAWGTNTGSAWSHTWVLLLFLPNSHFWTAGVGKEALLWVGLVYALACIQDFGRYVPGLLGVVISFAVRPLNGAVLLLLFAVRLVFAKTTQLPGKWIWVGILALLGVGAGYRLIYQMHMPGLTLSALEEFSTGQFAFLEGFGAGSEFPMHTYSWPRRLWTVLFLPLDSGNGSLWHLAAALENAFSLLLLVIAIIHWGWAGVKVSFPSFLLYGMAFGLLLTITYGLTLNNLGIIMRMKSFYMLFFLLGGWHLLIFPKKSVYCALFSGSNT